MKPKYFLLILSFIFVFIQFLYARPDLIIENYGNDKYGFLDKGMGGSYTLEDAVNGFYNVVSFTIQNDNSTFDNSTSQIYHINVIMPSEKWKYYFLYKGNKYTGQWATDIIKKGQSDTFSLYIMPPFGTSAKVYHIIINATYGDQVDSCDLYFNVKQTTKFDLSYIKKDNETIGEGVYETSYLDVQSTDVLVNFCDEFKGKFKIQNIGNKGGFFYIKFFSVDYSPYQFNFSLDNETITYLFPNYVKGFLKPGEAKFLNFSFKGYELKKSGNFYIFLYDSDLNIVDKYRISVSLIEENQATNYTFPEISTDSPNKYSALILVNTEDKDEQAVINKDGKFFKQVSLLKKNISIINLKDKGVYQVNSVCPVVPFLIQLDENLCPLKINYPLIFKRKGTDLVIPIILNLKDAPIILTVHNPDKEDASGNLYIYTNDGLLINTIKLELKQGETKEIKKSDLKLDDNYKFYWGYIKTNIPVEVYFTNKILNCYFYYEVPGLN